MWADNAINRVWIQDGTRLPFFMANIQNKENQQLAATSNASLFKSERLCGKEQFPESSSYSEDMCPLTPARLPVCICLHVMMLLMLWQHLASHVLILGLSIVLMPAPPPRFSLC